MFDFVENIIQSKPEDWTFPVDAAADLIKARLAAETEIRIYVDNSDNFGNQASSVLLMQTLIDQYGFTGEGKNVWMVYKEEKADKTRKKLSLLIKGFDASNPVATTTYIGVTINFITVEALNADSSKPQINYSFSGGGNPDPDSIDSKNWFAVNLKTKIFLLLQPYLWDLDGPDEIEYGEPYNENPAFPLQSDEGAGKNFSNRGWFISDEYWNPKEDDWTYYTDPASPGVSQELAGRTLLAKVLTEFVVAQGAAKVRFMPAYGIKGVSDAADPDEPYYENQMLLPPDQVLPTVVSTALGGSALAEKTPAIVVSMNTDMDDVSYDSSCTVSKCGPTRSEISAQQSFDTATTNKNKAQAELVQAQKDDSHNVDKLQSALTTSTETLTVQTVNNDAQIVAKDARETWLRSKNSPAGVNFLSSIARNNPNGGTTPAITQEALSTALALLVAPEFPRPAVLFLEIGSLPKIIFSYVMSLGTFPNVFEGANSAILALNQGKCYLRMKDVTWEDNDSERYPSAWAPATEAHNTVHEMSWKAADGVTGALLASPTSPANFVPNVTLTTNYLNEYFITQNPNLTGYYASIHDYYHNPVNGKLGIGLAYMNQAAINIGIPAPQKI